jgi:hypothetical protein
MEDVWRPRLGTGHPRRFLCETDLLRVDIESRHIESVRACKVQRGEAVAAGNVEIRQTRPIRHDWKTPFGGLRHSTAVIGRIDKPFLESTFS